MQGELVELDVLPTGFYEVELDNLWCGPSRNTGRPLVTIEYLVTEGAYQGRKLFGFYAVDVDTGKERLRALFSQLDPEYYAELTAGGRRNMQVIEEEGGYLGCKLVVETARSWDATNKRYRSTVVRERAS